MRVSRAWAIAGALAATAGAWAAATRGWLIDDAAISMAYGRNLWTGHGLVAQPGAAPVEGFSNPAWTLVVGLAALLPWPWAVAAIKALSLGLLGVAAWAIWHTVKGPDWWRGLVVVGAMAQAPVLIWGTSGLENPATLAVGALLLREAMQDRPRGAVVGALAGLAAWLRPDGLAWVVVLPLAGKDWRRAALVWLGAVGALTGGRLAYFGHALPNTSVAKSADPVGVAWAILTMRPSGFRAVAGAVSALVPRRGPWVALGLAVAASRARGRAWRGWVVLAAAAAAPALLPPDWMPEHRFASTAVALVWPVVAMSDRPRKLWALVVLASMLGGGARCARWLNEPTVPAASVATRARQLASMAGGQPVLQPDVGGALLGNLYPVVDAAGLCHRGIALGLRDRDVDAMWAAAMAHRPRVLHLHGGWARVWHVAERAPALGYVEALPDVWVLED